MDSQSLWVEVTMHKMILHKMPTAHVRISLQMSSSQASTTLSDVFTVTESALDFWH